MPHKSNKELVEAVAHQTGMSASKTASVIDAFFKEIEAALANGDEVDIGGCLKLYPDDMPPRTVVDPKTKKRTVIPVRRTVKARVLKAFRERVIAANKVRGIGIVLSAGVDDRFAAELVKELKPTGIKTVVEPDLAKAVKALGGRPRSADFLVVTPSVREADFEKIILQVKTSRSTAFLPVLRGAFDVKKYETPEGFKILPDHIFSTPIEVARQINGDLDRWREEKHYFRRQFRLRSGSSMDTINSLFAALDTLAGRILPGDAENYKLLSALHEALENAAHHGNKDSPAKFVSIDWIEDLNQVMITVKDQGDGFDFKAGLEAASLKSPDAVRHHMQRGAGTGGLGIKLMLEVFDVVEYSDGGRTLHLVKRKKT